MCLRICDHKFAVYGFFAEHRDLDFSSQTAHILTVALGAIVVLIPMRFLLPVLVPRESHDSVSETLFSTASEMIAFWLGVLMVAFSFWVHSVGAMTHARRDLLSRLHHCSLFTHSSGNPWDW